VHVHLESPNETVFAVVLGAILATLGGFLATQLERRLHRRERERGAALLFGEVLSALETITAIAGEARKRGDPYGSLTLRLIKAAQREIETYERNRASLYDLQNSEVRIRIHVAMVQVRLALEGVLDASLRIDEAHSKLRRTAPEDPDHLDAIRLLKILEPERDTAFAFTATAAGELKALVKALQPIARVDFEALKRFSGNPYEESA
jgi:hypothetical protein